MCVREPSFQTIMIHFDPLKRNSLKLTTTIPAFKKKFQYNDEYITSEINIFILNSWYGPSNFN